jgi:hypothetical protein
MTVGVAYDGHRTDFSQSEADADLIPAGTSVRVQERGDFETEVDVRTEQRNIGAYLTSTFDLTGWLALTVGGRSQNAHVDTSRSATGAAPTRA